MNKILKIIFMIIISSHSFAHDMPLDTKLKNIKKILNEQSKPGNDLEGFNLNKTDGKAAIDISSYYGFKILSTFSKRGSKSDFMKQRDQDLEIVTISVNKDEVDYELECILETVESARIQNRNTGEFRYSLGLLECTLHGDGTFDNHDLFWRKIAQYNFDINVYIKDIKESNNYKTWLNIKY